MILFCVSVQTIQVNVEWISYQFPLMDLINSLHKTTINIIDNFSVICRGFKKAAASQWSPDVFCGAQSTSTITFEKLINVSFKII